MKFLKYLAIAGNALYFLWIVYNGIDEGFASATLVQSVSYVGILLLLVFNAILLYESRE
jgi:hypothetical protein